MMISFWGYNDGCGASWNSIYASGGLHKMVCHPSVLVREGGNTVFGRSVVVVCMSSSLLCFIVSIGWRVLGDGVWRLIRRPCAAHKSWSASWKRDSSQTCSRIFWCLSRPLNTSKQVCRVSSVVHLHRWGPTTPIQRRHTLQYWLRLVRSEWHIGIRDRGPCRWMTASSGDLLMGTAHRFGSHQFFDFHRSHCWCSILSPDFRIHRILRDLLSC